MMVRRALFLLTLIGLTAYFLSLDFKGLSTARGIEQAQVAREIADGHGISTRCIRPLAWRQVEKKLKEDKGPAATLDLLNIPDTYYSPLGPLLNSLVLGTAKSTWELGEKQAIYIPDILIAGTSMVLLLASIGITYLLISRIFDAKIGGVTGETPDPGARPAAKPAIPSTPRSNYIPAEGQKTNGQFSILNL